VARARSLIYVEDQYFWSVDVAQIFADALRREPELRLIAVIPRYPDQDGRIALAPNLLGREPVLRMVRAAGGARFAVYSPENEAGTPIYVHAKVCVIDDIWACVGSDNANRRSWTHDSELSCAVLDDPLSPDTERASSWARNLRLELAREHLGARVPDETASDPARTFELFRTTAAALDAWHASGKVGPRPPGQLREYSQPALSPLTRCWAAPLYRLLFDPDGRSRRMRRSHSF
jgi:phosphatidylserine/phosphatidylglycerophosphate/cardiolipin synthase-like enzyme